MVMIVYLTKVKDYPYKKKTLVNMDRLESKVYDIKYI
jgi:hypothetical protein